MNLALAACLMVTLLSEKDLASTAPEAPERIRILAIHATSEGRDAPYLDPTLVPASAVLETMPYDTFRELSFHDLTIPYEVDSSAPLNEIYTFHCRLLRLTEQSEVVLEAHVTMKEGDTEIEALRVTGRAVRGEGMVLRGFAMPEGELVVVMSVAEARSESGSGGGSGESQSQQGSGGESGGEKQGDGGGSGDGDMEVTGEEPDPELQDPMEEESEESEKGVGISIAETDEEPPLPPELANLEGILRALEAVDQREQETARNRRFETRIRGAWW